MQLLWQGQPDTTIYIKTFIVLSYPKTNKYLEYMHASIQGMPREICTGGGFAECILHLGGRI